MEIKQLANQEIKDMKTEIRKYIEKDENKATTHQKKKKNDTTHQNLWDAAEVVLRGKLY